MTNLHVKKGQSLKWATRDLVVTACLAQDFFTHQFAVTLHIALNTRLIDSA